ncbi:MAG: hypothetical protein CSA97_04025 [Bacteroidetes bacterium]|nr:MAG: hypothetical protein CSA97_04025 [Bacteroidota bacterium]
MASCGGGQPASKGADSTSDSTTETQEAINSETDARGAEENDEAFQAPFNEPTIGYVADYRLYLYDTNTKGKRRVQEADSVFSCAIDPKSPTVFYTVIKNGELVLKRLPFQDGQPGETEDLGSYGDELKVEMCRAQTDGLPGRLFFTPSGDLVLPYNYVWDMFDFTKAWVYTPSKRMLKSVETDFTVSTYKPFLPEDKRAGNALIPSEELAANADLFSRNSGELMYKGVCLSCDLQLEHDRTVKRIEYGYPTFSADGSKIMFAAYISMGDMAHGPICIANTDGTNQRKLNEDGAADEIKPVFVGNSAVFAESHSKEQGEDYIYWRTLNITNPEDNAPVEIVKDPSYWCAK